MILKLAGIGAVQGVRVWREEKAALFVSSLERLCDSPSLRALKHRNRPVKNCSISKEFGVLGWWVFSVPMSQSATEAVVQVRNWQQGRHWQTSTKSPSTHVSFTETLKQKPALLLEMPSFAGLGQRPKRMSFRTVEKQKRLLCFPDGVRKHGNRASRAVGNRFLGAQSPQTVAKRDLLNPCTSAACVIVLAHGNCSWCSLSAAAGCSMRRHA